MNEFFELGKDMFCLLIRGGAVCEFAGVVVAAAAKDEVVAAVVAVAIGDDWVAFGEATMLHDGG